MRLRTAVLGGLFFLCGTAFSLPQETPPATNAVPASHNAGRMKAPSVISREEPQFTDVARKRKISTTVTLSLVVDPQGLPKDVRILHSGAEKFKKQKDRDAALTLDARAIEAVQHYRFEPALRDGLPVPVQINVEVSFQIF